MFTGLASDRTIFVPAIAVLLFAAVANGQTLQSDWTRINPVTALTVSSFANPPATDRPWARMNIPATADPAEIQAEVREMHASGISGIEIGQGAFPNNEQLVALYTAANRLGVKVSLSHGPTKTPDGYSIDSDHARKTLFVGKAAVDAGAAFEGPVPRGVITQGSRSGFGGARGPGGTRTQGGPPAIGGAPGAPGRPGGQRGPQATRDTLIAVLAYRCTASPCPATGPAQLDRASAVDLTATVTGKNTAGILGGTTSANLRWTAPSSPAGAQWLIAAFWARGVFAQPDPFSDEGYAELIRSMETGLSTEVQQLMRANGGDLFYDSHSVDRGSPDELWTNRMAEEFSARRPYRLIPNLPALFREVFDFSDGSAPRVRADFYAVRGDLWLEKQIAPLRKWVRGRNSRLRVQVEGEANLTIPITDMVLAAAAVDRAEHESLFVGDEVDNYLPMASANHMTGNTWYSTECCAAFGRNYAQTFQDAVIRMNKSFAGGITKLVYHVYSYRDGATWKWPGYHNFGPAGFSNAWGPRNPYWVDARLYNDYFARNQQALTQGRARTDVAVYMQNYLYPPSQVTKTRHWVDLKLQEAGYTRDYLNPTMLDLPNASVTGNRLAANGPAYKALIIDSEQGPPTDPGKTSMPVEVARKILGYTRAGLPVIVVGAPPDRTPGNTPGSDASLKAVISELLAEKTVFRVAHESDVPDRLRALGIRPAAEPATPSPMLSIRRRDAATRTDFYFLYNQGIVSPDDEPSTLFEPATGEPVEREVSFEGRGRPYLLDAWSGRITPLLNYSVSGDRITIPIRLARDSSVLIAISEDPTRFGTAAPAVHVTRATADGAAMGRNGIVIRASKSGTYSTQLSNGQTVRSVIGSVPSAIDLTNAKWHLSVEDWQPSYPYETTFGPAASETRRSKIEVDLDGLKAWPAIRAIQDVSGLGTYTTAVDLPSAWSAANGAVLSLGEVFDSYALAVNGQAVSIDQLAAEADIGAYLKAGRNVITVRVATTLNNRLAKLDPSVANRGLVQAYGLIGPVVLKPYSQATVWRHTAK